MADHGGADGAMNRLFTLAMVLAVSAGAPAGEDAGKTASEPETPKKVLERLERKLSGVRTVQAKFVQVKRLAMFTHKVVIKGRLTVKNPDRIAWRADSPVKYSLVIIGPELKQWDEDTDRVQTFRLDKNPMFRAAFQQLTAWFSGRYAVVRRKYDVRVEQSAPYILVFTPRKGSGMEKIIKRVRVVFREDERYIEKLTVHEGGGDTAVISFSDTRLNEPIDARAWEVRPGD